jgi:hypothetical protein
MRIVFDQLAHELSKAAGHTFDVVSNAPLRSKVLLADTLPYVRFGVVLNLTDPSHVRFDVLKPSDAALGSDGAAGDIDEQILEHFAAWLEKCKAELLFER